MSKQFRIWDSERKEWERSRRLSVNLLGGSIGKTKHDYDVNSIYRFQQFTGSTDSAQKPIYEGDVVLWHTEDPFENTYTHKKMIVGWNQRCMQFRLYDFPNEVGEKSGEQFWAEDVRVIGHIFDYENEECRWHLYRPKEQ